eukprot:6202791-Pleurochrysis_carterae.AAC.6
MACGSSALLIKRRTARLTWRTLRVAQLSLQCRTASVWQWWQLFSNGKWPVLESDGYLKMHGELRRGRASHALHALRALRAFAQAADNGGSMP